MSNEEIVSTVTINYDVRGIDRSIRTSQSLLFTVNAIRLGVEDFKRLGEDPSFSNFLWTGIQLTRIWTNLLRLVKRTNQAQRFGLLQGAIGARGGVARGAGSVLGGAALGQTTLFGGGTTVASTGLWATVIGLASTPIVLGIPLGAFAALAVVSVGTVGNDVRQRRIRKEYIQRQREIAKSQGLEN